MKNKKVIISGANGQDGAYMIRFLLKNTECDILAAVRRTSQPILGNIKDSLNNPRVKLVHLDLNDVHSITTLIKNEQPDFFINLGASTFVPDSWNQPALVMQTNAISLIHILEAVREFIPTCRVYSAGSSEQWGDVLNSPQDETTPMRPRSIYGVSKCAASHICKVYRESYGLYVVHGILLNHESELRQSCFVTRKITQGVARICHAIKNKTPFKPIELGNLDAQRDWSHSEDFVYGIWLMMNQNEPKDYVLSSDETHSVREFVELAFKESGIGQLCCWYKGAKPENEIYGFTYFDSDGEPVVMPVVIINSKFYRPAEVQLLHGCSQKIRQELGWQPKVSFQELVRRMVRHDIETTLDHSEKN